VVAELVELAELLTLVMNTMFMDKAHLQVVLQVTAVMVEMLVQLLVAQAEPEPTQPLEQAVEVDAVAVAVAVEVPEAQPVALAELVVTELQVQTDF
jgi:hypothetical protein